MFNEFSFIQNATETLGLQNLVPVLDFGAESDIAFLNYDSETFSLGNIPANILDAMQKELPEGIIGNKEYILDGDEDGFFLQIRSYDMDGMINEIFNTKTCSEDQLEMSRVYLDNDNGTYEDNVINQMLWLAVQNIQNGESDSAIVRSAEAYLS